MGRGSHGLNYGSLILVRFLSIGELLVKGLADGVDQPVRSRRRQINADREQKTQTGGCETENQKNEAHGKRQVIKMDQKHQCIDNISEENSDQHGQCVLDGDAALNDDLPDETYKMQQNGQIPDGQRCDIGQGSGDGGVSYIGIQKNRSFCRTTGEESKLSLTSFCMDRLLPYVSSHCFAAVSGFCCNQYLRWLWDLNGQLPNPFRTPFHSYDERLRYRNHLCDTSQGLYHESCSLSQKCRQVVLLRSSSFIHLLSVL